jgi:hypothetical protein
MYIYSIHFYLLDFGRFYSIAILFALLRSWLSVLKTTAPIRIRNFPVQMVLIPLNRIYFSDGTALKYFLKILS